MMDKISHIINLPRDKNGIAFVRFPSIDVQLDLPRSYTTCTIHLERKKLYAFRQGTYIFSRNNPPEKKRFCKIFSFEGQFEDEIFFPQIKKKVPEEKYDLRYAHSGFEDDILHLTFHSTTWQIGDFGAAYDLRTSKYGKPHPVR